MSFPELPVSKALLIDKPSDISSFAALGAVKKALGTKKVGHTGTLDPFATGLLIAVTGKLTRCASLISDLDKEYQTTIRFGQETDTLDTEGTVVAVAKVPSLGTVEESIQAFIGEIRQVPPIYSAVKVKGRRAYAEARSGRTVELPPRTVKVDKLEILGWEPPDLELRIRCSKGTYIRSIARDLALRCKSRGFCFRLRRTHIGPFSVDDALIPHELTSNSGMDPVLFFQKLGISVAPVEPRAAALMRRGVPIGQIPGTHVGNSLWTLYVDDSEKPAALVDCSSAHYRIVFD